VVVLNETPKMVGFGMYSSYYIIVGSINDLYKKINMDHGGFVLIDN
jgi:hypothetical protein